MNDDVITTIREALSLSSRRITPRTPLRSIASDSMDAIELLAALEDKFDVAIEVDALMRFETVGDVIAYVTEHRGNARTRPDLERF
jgi:acyl carrier protein